VYGVAAELAVEEDALGEDGATEPAGDAVTVVVAGVRAPSNVLFAAPEQPARAALTAALRVKVASKLRCRRIRVL
jgi:hypothetical protein